MTKFFGSDNKTYVTLASIALSFILVVSVAAYASAADHSDELQKQIRNGNAKNVILMIGDGMGDSEITIARNYEVGAAGRLEMDALPLTGAVTTYSVSESSPSQPDYDPDSASTGTAWSTGVKTSDGRISTSPGTDQDLKTILEIAQEKGLKTGLVSTAEMTDATPAVAASHVNDRSCQGPADMANCPQDAKGAGGPGSIAEQMVDHKVNVILGGGKQRFDQSITGGPDAGKTVLRSATGKGYAFVGNASSLQNVSPNTKLVLGLFSPSNMALEWNGALAKPFPGTGPQTCQENQRPSNQPSLEDMTEKAIQLLDSQSGKGFFLQVEGASIDKQDHASNPCAQIGETIAFDKAVKVAMDFAKNDKNTLVIVTADHAHTSQIIEKPTSPAQPGAFSTLLTKEGSEMTVLYATAPPGQSQQHTGTQLRVAAMGPHAADVTGVIDNTDLFSIMKAALKL